MSPLIYEWVSPRPRSLPTLLFILLLLLLPLPSFKSMQRCHARLPIFPVSFSRFAFLFLAMYSSERPFPKKTRIMIRRKQISGRREVKLIHAWYATVDSVRRASERTREMLLEELPRMESDMFSSSRSSNRLFDGKSCCGLL